MSDERWEPEGDYADQTEETMDTALGNTQTPMERLQEERDELLAAANRAWSYLITHDVDEAGRKALLKLDKAIAKAEGES